ncbi:MAG: DUF1295 domain-containing protein [Spirochaetota bacterium]
MSSENKTAILSLPIIHLIGVLLAWAGSQYSQNFSGMPIYAICIFVAFLVQWLVFIPAFRLQTEKFYDLTGSITYITTASLALFLSKNIDLRSRLVWLLIVIWAGRLGSFLFMRIRKDGKDRRFDSIKTSFFRFLMAWSIQGLWVSFSCAAAFVAITSSRRLPMDVWAYAGLGIWIVGFAIEAIADKQKSIFKQNPDNKDKFIQSGLWSWSRHPNYFGEILLWLGIAVIAFPTLQGWQYFTLISPVFVVVLLTKISGVPMLEEKSDKKWGGLEEYENYKKKTSVLILLPPKKI